VKLSRRTFLRGLGGAVLGLPVLESIGGPRNAHAALSSEPFAIFFRQANGVAQEANTGEIGAEPERFWPRSLGALTPETMNGRAVDELVGFREKLLIVKNVNMYDYDYGDGHARGAMQGLTARGPTVTGAGGDSEAAGESIDHRIGRELNPNGRDSLFLYAGQSGGWLGGPCISYRSSGVRRSALHNPWLAYQTIVGGETGLTPEAQQKIASRQSSINDLVRDQLGTLLSAPRLSQSDRRRIQLHLESVREIEVELTCRLAEDEAMRLQGASRGFDSTDGDLVLGAARLHFEVAALAVACGYTRSVALQIGSGNDGSTRYRNLETRALMENYHYISHRRASHDSSGDVIEGSDLLHHMIDRQFARTFRHLLEKLDAYPMPDGKTLLDHGVAVWYNDNSNGPPHGARNVPYVIAGGANGFLKRGVHLAVEAGRTDPNHNKMLNTIGTAVGVRKSDGSNLDNFGDPMLPRGILSALLA
jgi:hypothetical protein